MNISKPSAVAAAMLALGLGACDRLPGSWPFKAAPSSVTVKLPPARTAGPGFAFATSKPAAKPELRETAVQE